MRYISMANTICEYVEKEIESGARIYRIILPSYPAELLRVIGEQIEENCKRQYDRRIVFRYGISYNLGQKWQKDGTVEDQTNFRIIRNKGWYDEEDSFTYLRNEIPEDDVDCLLIVLAGYDHITDQGSLQDFFHLNDQALWKMCLRGSFKKWVIGTLGRKINIEEYEPQIKSIDNLLCAIFQKGVSDLVGISDFLDTRDLSEVSDGSEALNCFLLDLSYFDLPCLVGLASRKKAVSFEDYITKAQQFLNHSMYIAEEEITNACKKIDDFRSKSHNDNFELGNFNTLDELLDQLKKFIRNRDGIPSSEFMKPDFSFILDKILNWRVSKRPTSRQKTHNIEGQPPEVFLRALWLALRDYRKYNEDSNSLRGSLSISFSGIQFKHDFEDDENQMASKFLTHILGGIDKLLEERIDLIIEGQKHEIKSSLEPNNHNKGFSFRHSRSGKPSYIFDVCIKGEDKEDPDFHMRFSWSLPQFHSCRVLSNLMDWAYGSFSEVNYGPLPVYSIRFVDEVFNAQDGDEMNRILIHALQNKDRKVKDQLSGLQGRGTQFSNDELQKLGELSHRYQSFLKAYDENGFFSAITESTYHALRKACSDVYDSYLDSENSLLGSFLLKAFLLVPYEYTKNDSWPWRKYIPYAIVTPLHPAMLDMLLHQYVYLFDCFNYYAIRELRDPKGRFNEKQWNQIVDLAELRRPLFGTLANENGYLNANVHGYDYVHLIGDCDNKFSSRFSRFLMEYNEDEDEDIPDTELFRDTRESLLIRRTLSDYIELNPQAEDGITVGVFCGHNIQPVIAGINQYLEDLFEKEAFQTYSLKLVVFSSSEDDSTIIKWVNAWKERWRESENRKHYRCCNLSILFNVIARGYSNFDTLIKKDNYDLFFYMNFIKPGTSYYSELKERKDAPDNWLKYPVLEKMCCRSNTGMVEQRERILSQNQFKLAMQHSEVMERLKSRHSSKKRHVLIGKSEYSEWKPIIDITHQCSVWVICIDPVIDEHLLRNGRINKREIIGFGTGVGMHGENNYTISTEHFSITDIQKRISAQIQTLFCTWEKETADEIAAQLISEAGNIGGLSLVRATGPKDFYIHDYMAYALMRKLIPRDKTAFCDEIISLDSCRHWFNEGEEKSRPDLLRLRVTINNGKCYIDAQVIECKLAAQSDYHLTAARQQIEIGLKRLVECFLPRQKNSGDEDSKDTSKPDQRYWWMQLHRLIASKGEVDYDKYPDALGALEDLSDGLYCINWNAATITIWTDLLQEDISMDTWQVNIEEKTLPVLVYSLGGSNVREIALDNYQKDIFEGAHGIMLCHETIQDQKQCSDESSEVIAQNGILPEGSENEMKELPGLNKSGESVSVVGRYPERVLLGEEVNTNRPIYWEFGHPELPNRHMLIFGASGTGKTYAVQALLCELAKEGQNSIIVDYTDGFTPGQIEKTVKERVRPTQHVVLQEPLPINPFRRQINYIDSIEIPENAANTAQRVSGVFSNVYSFGDQQKSALYSAIKDGINEEGSKFNIHRLIERLQLMQEDGGPMASPAASVISKIQPFADMNPFGFEDPESWEKLYNDSNSHCHVIQLASFSADMSRLITEFSLFDLYRYYRGNGSKDDPKVIVLDEIQNLDHGLNSPLGQFLTEGRKFGISLILATQTLSNLEKDERDRLFQASHKLFFKPADTEVKSYAQILEIATGRKSEEWVEKLASLKKGQCYSLGYSMNDANGKFSVKPYKVQITSLEKRF